MAEYRFVFTFLIAASLGQSALAIPLQQQNQAEAHEDDVALLLKLGKGVSPIGATDIRGRNLVIPDPEKNHAIVVIFLDFRCPISNRIVPELNSLAARYAEKGVVFQGVVGDGMTEAEIATKGNEFKIPFSLCHDPGLKIAGHLRATTTPQVFLIDKQGNLRYFGAVDDQYADRTTRLPARSNEHLAKALDQVLAGQPADPDHTLAVGCPIQRVKRVVPESGVVTFHRDVEPLLQKHCQRCHHPLDVAPFSLLTFDEALNWADDIKDYVTSRRMPPWPITGGVPLEDDFSMSSAEISTISKWVDEGCPKGDPKDAPKPLVFKSGDEWDDPAPPDLILRLPEAFHLAAKGQDHYRTIVFPLGNTDTKYIRKYQFIVGNRKILHHAQFFFDGTGLVLDAQKRLGKAKPSGSGDEDYGPGYESGMGLGFIPKPGEVSRNKENPGGGFGGWVPGAGPLELPANAGYMIPPDSNIVWQIHYHRTGKPEKDDGSRLAIWFKKTKPQKFLSGHIVDTTFRLIPKGAQNFRSTGSKLIPVDSHLYLVGPHMHNLGKELRVWLQPKGSSDRTLVLELKNWDFNWQSRYILKEPLFIPKGSTIHLETVFDNSSKNPNNPFTTPRTIFLGQGTNDEMGLAVLGLLTDTPPEGGTDWLPYFERLLEAEALKKLIGAAGSR